MRYQSHQDLVVPYVTEQEEEERRAREPEGRTGEMGKGVCGSKERSGDSVMLFGKMIRVPAAAGGEHQKSQGLTVQDPATEIQEKDQESSGSGEGSSRKSDETEENASEEQGVAATARTSKLELEKNDKDDKSNSREKAPKKPEKILPCPRCNSNDTKFCYFNNYNVNQPRHFCRNCQRYWTAGGCMRNVPVGAGRRKSKSSAATQNRQATMQSAASGIVPFAISDQTTGTVLSFGPEVAGLNSRRMGEEKEYSNGSSVTAVTTSTAGEERETQMFQGCPIGPLWVYQWNSSPHPGHQIPLYPASATTQWPFSAQGAWGMPRLSLLPAQNQSLASEPTSPLGKHSRDGHMLAHGTKPNRLLIPRTMRIDDPRDAADSSVWLGIGVENSKGGGAGLFKAFGSNDEASSVRMHPNPAALSRSLLFRETA